MRVSYISSWGPEVRCGLRTYQEYLIGGFHGRDSDIDIDVTRLDRYNDIDGQYLEWLAGKATRNDPDVVHIQHEGGRYGFEESALYDALPGDISVVTTIHSAAQLQDRQKREILRGSDKTIVHNTEELESLKPVGAEEVVIIPHGCVIRYTPSKARSIATLQLNRIPECTALTFGFSGPWKSLETVQDAVHVTAGITHIHAGEWHTDQPHGQYAQKIVDRARRIIPSRAAFTGYVDDGDLNAVFGAADFAVYANKWSSESGSMAEMLGAGVPVIARDVAPFNDGRPVLLFDDQQELEQHMRTLRDDEDLRESLSRRGREWAERRSWEEIAGAHSDLYRHITGTATWDQSQDPHGRYERARLLTRDPGNSEPAQVDRMVDAYVDDRIGETALLVNRVGDLPIHDTFDTVILRDLDRFRHQGTVINGCRDGIVNGGSLLVTCAAPSAEQNAERPLPLWPHELQALAEEKGLTTESCTLLIGSDENGDMTDKTVAHFKDD